MMSACEWKQWGKNAADSIWRGLGICWWMVTRKHLEVLRKGVFPTIYVAQWLVEVPKDER